MEQIKMINGVEIPVLGFGTYKAADGEGVLEKAIECGYRYFDTASFYETEEALGRAVAHSGLGRKDFFIASKLWKDEMGYDNALRAFDRSMARLGCDYLDLYMIHWPLPDPDFADWRALDADTWRALEKLYEEGSVRAIGLSNFLPHHIENIRQTCRIMPMSNQLEFHPGYTQEAALRYCMEQGMVVQGWSPLARGRLAGDPLVERIARAHRVTESAVCLRYAVSRGVIPLPKASSKERMMDNLDIFSFTLTPEEIHMLDTMPPAGWSGEHPDRKRVAL